jgi:RNA-binding motif X-linked protein 2
VDGIKLHRDKDSGKSRGFAFLRYRDPKSCVLAVDNFNGANLLDRKVSVNHVKDYKHADEMDVVAEAIAEASSEDDDTRREKRDKRKKEKREEARNVELMRAAMSQNPEERKRVIDKEKRRSERRKEKEEKRDEDDFESSRSKRPKYEPSQYDSPHKDQDIKREV